MYVGYVFNIEDKIKTSLLLHLALLPVKTQKGQQKKPNWSNKDESF